MKLFLIGLISGHKSQLNGSENFGITGKLELMPDGIVKVFGESLRTFDDGTLIITTEHGKDVSTWTFMPMGIAFEVDYANSLYLDIGKNPVLKSRVKYISLNNGWTYFSEAGIAVWDESKFMFVQGLSDLSSTTPILQSKPQACKYLRVVKESASKYRADDYDGDLVEVEGLGFLAADGGICLGLHTVELGFHFKLSSDDKVYLNNMNSEVEATFENNTLTVTVKKQVVIQSDEFVHVLKEDFVYFEELRLLVQKSGKRLFYHLVEGNIKVGARIEFFEVQTVNDLLEYNWKHISFLGLAFIRTSYGLGKSKYQDSRVDTNNFSGICQTGKHISFPQGLHTQETINLCHIGNRFVEMKNTGSWSDHWEESGVTYPAQRVGTPETVFLFPLIVWQETGGLYMKHLFVGNTPLLSIALKEQIALMQKAAIAFEETTKEYFNYPDFKQKWEDECESLRSKTRFIFQDINIIQRQMSGQSPDFQSLGGWLKSCSHTAFVERECTEMLDKTW